MSELKVPCAFQGEGAMSGGDPRGPAWLVRGCGQCRWAFRAMDASEHEGILPRGFAFEY